jgi:hypothetical protein
MSRLMLSRLAQPLRGFHNTINLRTGGDPMTLLHELFPEEADAVGTHKLKADGVLSPAAQNRHIPRLPLTTDVDPQDEKTPKRK